MIDRLISWLRFSQGHSQLASPPCAAEGHDTATHERIRSLTRQGVDYRRQAQFSIARAYIGQAIELAESHLEQSGNIDVAILRVRALHELAFTEELAGCRDLATQLYRQCLNIQTRLGDDIGRSATLYQLAHLAAENHDVEAAIALYQQALPLQEATNDVAGQTATLHQLAYLTKETYPSKAITYFERLRQLDQQGDDLESRIAALHQMGQVLERQGALDRALRIYRESLQLHQTDDTANAKAITLTQVGDIERRRKNLRLAESAYEAALSILNRLEGDDLHEQRTVVLHYLAEVKARLGETAVAMAYYK